MEAPNLSSVHNAGVQDILNPMPSNRIENGGGNVRMGDTDIELNRCQFVEHLDWKQWIIMPVLQQ
jgi:hypothetical protein